MQLAKITLTRFLNGEGVVIDGFDVEGDPDIVMQLGMLELAKDSAIRVGMGEVPDES